MAELPQVQQVLRRRERRFALSLLVLGAAILLLSTQFSVAAASTINELCDDGELDVVQGWDDAMGDWRVSGLDFTGLGAGCEGVVVGVEILGNDAGDTSRSSDVLATLYSDENPCTGQEIDPVIGSVHDGSLTLDLCDTGPVVRTFEVTGFTFYSLGPAKVLGEQKTRDGVPTDDPKVLDERDSRNLPSTGSSPLAGGLLGVGAVLVGTGLLRLVRRQPRRREMWS